MTSPLRTPPAANGVHDLRGGLRRPWLPPRTLAGFVAAVVAVLAIAVVSYLTLRMRSENTERMTHALRVTQQLEMLLSSIKDAETSQRGFLLTHDEQYLALYDVAAATLPQALAVVRELVVDNPAQRDRMDQLEDLTHSKLAELKKTVDLGRGGRVDEAIALVREDHGKVLMDQIRALSDDIRDTERAILESRTRDWETVTTVSTLVTFGGGALLLVLVGAAAVFASRDFREQRDEAWLRTGQTGLADQMQGERALEELGDRVAGFVAAYAGAQIGAVCF